MTMCRLLKESNVRTVPALPEKPQAQDLLSVLRGLKLEQRYNSLQHNVASDSSKGCVRLSIDEISSERSLPQQNHAHRPPENDTRSHVQQPMLAPQFTSPPHQSAPSQLNISGPMHPEFSSPYTAFEYGQPMPCNGPQIVAQHPPQLSQTTDSAFAARQSWLSPRGNVMMQEPWRYSSDSLSPGVGTPLDRPSNRPTPLECSPYLFAGGSMGSSDQIQQEWSWAYSSQLGYFGEALDSQGDADVPLELE